MATRTLEMTFSNVAGKNSTIRVSDARTDLTAAEVSNAMDLIVARNIFATSGGDLVAKVGAQVVAREVQEITLP
ncbi:MAG: DUF2922 domain-containing protein [Ignavibacteriales bacterium]